MSQVKYTLSEGTLTLPEAVQDRSMTILSLPKAGASLVLTRAWDVKPGEEETYLKSQVAKIKRDISKTNGAFDHTADDIGEQRAVDERILITGS